MVTAADVVAIVERFAPLALALPGDPVGLQVGRLDKPVERVCIALDASTAVVERAVTAGADLLVTHHELLYQPLSRLDTASWRGRAIRTALEGDLTIYAAHTNLDVTAGGVNDVIAQRLGLTDVDILDVTGRERLRKLVVFVPQTHADAVRAAVCDAGAGFIGNYSHCTFNTSGEGTFLAREGANPFLGTVGEWTRTGEVRIETVVPELLTQTVVKAMMEAHPYEEVAYDLYPLELVGRPYGLGRVGNLPAPQPLGKFAALVQERLGLSHIRFGGDPDTSVLRVAVLGGAGGRFADHARARGAQVLVTADCNHHQVAEAWEDGLAIVDATHAALETLVLDKLHRVITDQLAPAVDVFVTDVHEDPFTWV